MKRMNGFEAICATARIVIFTMCCVGAFAASARSQTHTSDSSTKGFSLGGHVAVIGSNPGSFDLNGQRTDPARVTTAGGGLLVAYGLNEWLAIALNGDGREFQEDRHLAFADIGVQFFLPGGNRLRPHLDVAMTGRRAEFETATGAIDTRGHGVSIGGGVLYFWSRSLALEAALLRTAGDLDRHSDNERDAIGVSGTRLLMGVRWYPGR